MLRILLGFLLLLPLTSTAGVAALGDGLQPSLGRIIHNYSSSIVSADGSGLPQGSGSAEEGEMLYKTHCAACHGIDGRQPGNLLAGGAGSLATARPIKTVGSYWPYATTLYDYIARAMPYNKEKSLTVDEVYAITAYVLVLNGILDRQSVLSDKNLADIKLPNRDGFIELRR